MWRREVAPPVLFMRWQWRWTHWQWWFIYDVPWIGHGKCVRCSYGRPWNGGGKSYIIRVCPSWSCSSWKITCVLGNLTLSETILGGSDDGISRITYTDKATFIGQWYWPSKKFDRNCKTKFSQTILQWIDYKRFRRQVTQPLISFKDISRGCLVK